MVYGWLGVGAADEISTSISGSGAQTVSETTAGDKDKARFACELEVSGIALTPPPPELANPAGMAGSSPNGSNLYDGGMRMDTERRLLLGGGLGGVRLGSGVFARPARRCCGPGMNCPCWVITMPGGGVGPCAPEERWGEGEWVRSRRWWVYMCVLCVLMLGVCVKPCAA